VRNAETIHHSSAITYHSSHSSFPALEALASLFILNLTLQPLVDPDFGWHLRTGLDLIAQGWRLPATDPYSHTMPDWPWVEHAWLTDGLIGLLYASSWAGPLLVIIFFAVITTAALLLAVAPARTGWTAQLLAVTAVLWIGRPFLGARTHTMTLLGFGFLLWLWSRLGRGKDRVLWILPPLFLLWANLHGGFVAGLVLLSLLLAGSIGLQLLTARWPMLSERVDTGLPRPRLGLLCMMLGFAILATLVNPYGVQLYREIVASLNDRFMIETLHEWQPVSLSSPAGRAYVAYLAALGVAMLLWYRRWEPLRWMLLGTFLAWSLLHWRNVPFFLLLSVPLVAELLALGAEWLRSSMGTVMQQPKRWLLAVTFGAGLAAAVLGPEHLQQVLKCGLAPAEYFEGTAYPIEAIRWTHAHLEEVGLRPYNDYGYGGFLTWWLPERKVFIDGRMPAWRLGDRWIFYNYVALTAWDPPVLDVLDKYAVDWALVERETPLHAVLGRHAGWRRVYEDKKVTIFIRKMAIG
jgi:hypothetical protein